MRRIPLKILTALTMVGVFAYQGQAVLELKRTELLLHIATYSELTHSESESADHAGHDHAQHADGDIETETEDADTHTHVHRHAPDQPEHDHNHVDMDLLTTASTGQVTPIFTMAIIRTPKQGLNKALFAPSLPSSVVLASLLRPPIS